MNKICDVNLCTACGACENICPKKCVVRKRESSGFEYLQPDTKTCIDCGKCLKVCPNVVEPEYQFPLEAHAAWANDINIHRAGASGGIASVLYLYAIKQGMYCAGVEIDNKFEVHYKLTDSSEDIERFRNSKYTFSFMDNIYYDIVCLLKEKKNVLFVGLPCQVAALINYTKQFSFKGQLVTADLVCHGVPPADYLKQHIKTVSKNKKVTCCFFRDPCFSTDKFVFSLYNKHDLIYKKGVHVNDCYQIGYHKAIIYRENCYNCKYAKRTRVGDLTLSDYRGFGKLAPYPYEKQQVSCVLINSEVGKAFYDAVLDTGMIKSYQRPVLEPLSSDKQLNSASKAPKERERFIKEYNNCCDYDIAAKSAFKNIIVKNIVSCFLCTKQIKTLIKKMIPKSLKAFLKTFLKK